MNTVQEKVCSDTNPVIRKIPRVLLAPNWVIVQNKPTCLRGTAPYAVCILPVSIGIGQ